MHKKNAHGIIIALIRLNNLTYSHPYLKCLQKEEAGEIKTYVMGSPIRNSLPIDKEFLMGDRVILLRRDKRITILSVKSNF